MVHSRGLHDPGPVRWQLALCLLAAWVLIFLCMLKGIRSSGKVTAAPVGERVGFCVTYRGKMVMIHLL